MLLLPLPIPSSCFLLFLSSFSFPHSFFFLLSFSLLPLPSSSFFFLLPFSFVLLPSSLFSFLFLSSSFLPLSSSSFSSSSSSLLLLPFASSSSFPPSLERTIEQVISYKTLPTDGLVGYRSVARSLGCSVDRSVARSLGCSVARSVARSLGCSFRSLDRSGHFAHSVARPNSGAIE